jgi:hypothetical protein
LTVDDHGPVVVVEAGRILVVCVLELVLQPVERDGA